MNLLYIKNRLAKNLASHPRSEANYILSHMDTIVCFCNLDEPYHSAIAVTDIKFNPIFLHETDAYAHACGISDSGRYAIFQTANSPGNDSGSAFFIDVPSKKIIWKKHISYNWKSITSYFIDEKKQIIFEHHDRDRFHYEYSFSGLILNEESAVRSPYTLIRQAEETIKTLATDFNFDKEARAIKLINSAASFPDMSQYQIMRARVSLINVYIANKIYGNAYDLCKTTIEAYPKAPIKKKMQQLENLKRDNPNVLTYSQSLKIAYPDLCYKK